MEAGDLIDVFDLKGRFRCEIRITEVYPVRLDDIPKSLWPIVDPWENVSMAHLYIGIAIAIYGAMGLVSNLRFVSRALRTQGRVVGHEEKRDSDGSTFAPVFTFIDADGAAHRVTSDWSSSLKLHRVGKPIEVLYLKGRPEKARTHSIIVLYVFPLIWSAMGIGFAAWG